MNSSPIPESSASFFKASAMDAFRRIPEKKYATFSVVMPLRAATVNVGREESPGFTWPTDACWLPSDCQTPFTMAVFTNSVSSGGLGSCSSAFSASTGGGNGDERILSLSSSRNIWATPSFHCFQVLSREAERESRTLYISSTGSDVFLKPSLHKDACLFSAQNRRALADRGVPSGR